MKMDLANSMPSETETETVSLDIRWGSAFGPGASERWLQEIRRTCSTDVST